jgi:hypothetical protein
LKSAELGSRSGEKRDVKKSSAPCETPRIVAAYFSGDTQTLHSVAQVFPAQRPRGSVIDDVKYSCITRRALRPSEGEFLMKFSKSLATVAVSGIILGLGAGCGGDAKPAEAPAAEGAKASCSAAAASGEKKSCSAAPAASGEKKSCSGAPAPAAK